MKDFTKDELEKLLIDADEEHAQFEEDMGEKDEDWAEWYADYIIKRLKKDKNPSSK